MPAGRNMACARPGGLRILPDCTATAASSKDFSSSRSRIFSAFKHCQKLQVWPGETEIFLPSEDECGDVLVMRKNCG